MSIWLLIQCLTLAAYVALIKPMRSHTCVTAWLEVAHCQAPQPTESSGISYRAVLSTCTTAGMKRLLILYSGHVTMFCALVSIVERSSGSVPYPVHVCAELLGGCFCHFLARLYNHKSNHV